MEKLQMNVKIFVEKNHYVFGWYLGLLMEDVEEGKRAVKEQQRLIQILILIGQLVTYFQNVMHARHL